MVTMKEISERAGVTATTVSKILNGKTKGDRSDAVLRAARVKKIAAEMGYRLNRSAIAIRTGRTGSVGMLLSPQMRHTLRFADFEQGLVDALEARNLLLVTGMMNPKLFEDDASYVPRIVGESLVDGLLINYVYEIPPTIQRLITEHNRPAIWINSKHDADCVYPDDEGAAFAAVQYLLERGHRKIAYGMAGGKPDTKIEHYSYADRRNGYLRAMRKAGLVPHVWESDVVLNDQNYAGHALRNSHTLLSQLGDATALLHGTGVEPLLLAASQRNIQIPRDLSLISFTNTQEDPSSMTCTRVVVPFYRLGQEAVAMLCQKINDGNASLPPRVLKFGVTEGQTVVNLK